MLKPEEAFFADLVNRESGIVLGDDKGYLLKARLTPIARERGYQDLEEFYEKVRNHVDSNLKKALVEALTTNETLFFRDQSPFRILQDELIPELRKNSETPLQIWCAAASTGQEPYSIVMSFLEKWPTLSPSDLKILATDIDTQAIEKGKSGVYSQIEINRGLPVMMLAKYFRQEEGKWVLSEKVREYVTWRSINLTQPFFLPGPFDLIFIRNVLIYFNVEVKKKILDRIIRLLKPGNPSPV